MASKSRFPLQNLSIVIRELQPYDRVFSLQHKGQLHFLNPVRKLNLYFNGMNRGSCHFEAEQSAISAYSAHFNLFSSLEPIGWDTWQQVKLCAFDDEKRIQNDVHNAATSASIRLPRREPRKLWSKTFMHLKG